MRPSRSCASRSNRHPYAHSQDIPESSLTREMSPRLNSLLEREPLQIYNLVDPHALSTALEEPYLFHILYGEPSFAMV